ncbi:hypothetical protein GH714_004995 [Hevea brasiliensis]|uniref:non-specific serine/threonine protein kinase n=1 Tax=Hevea brasiliensis TaxID=3981 RepID=A0A6A6L0D8_HEVBR|nr:hypothetical protein GH714_004995 [Hevea brasiliensis]
MEQNFLPKLPAIQNNTVNLQNGMTDMDPCCRTLLSLFGVGLAQHLKETSLFQLPCLPTSVSCLQDYQTKLSSLSLPDNIVSHCFDPMEVVLTPNICAHGQTFQDWVAKLGKSTVLDTACRPDLADLASCSACVAAAFKVHSDLILIDGNTTHAAYCLYFTVLYAAGIVNEFGHESDGALTCLFGLELDLESNMGSPSKGNSALVFGLTGTGVAILVMSSFLGLYFWYDKKWRKKNNSTFPFHLEEQESRPRPRPNTGSIWFKIDDLEKATENFSQDNFIGRGGFGLVYKGILSDGTTVAVKRIIESSIQGDAEFCNEVEINSNLKHRNLVPLTGCCVSYEDENYRSPQVFLITDRVWPLVKAGNIEDAVDVSLLRDRDLSNLNPKATMERFLLVGILCAHVIFALRPTILDALKMLEGDIEVPPTPDRPMPLSHPSSFGDGFTVSPALSFPQLNNGDMLRTLLSLFGIGLAKNLKETSVFQLPSLPTSVSCLQDYQRNLSSLSLPDDILSHCFDPMEFVLIPNMCAQVQTLQDWVAKLGKSTVIDTACRPDLVDLASCGACVTAGFKVQSDLLLIDGNKTHATDCFYFTVLCAAGIVNEFEFGPESDGAVTCIFGLDLKSIMSFSKRHSALVFGLTGASVGILVMSKQGSRPKRRPNTGSIWFKIHDLQKATENFSQKNIIGKGGFGLVYKGILSNGTTVAVKRIIESDIQGDAEFCNEVEINSNLKHRNLVPLRGCCVVDEEENYTERGGQRTLLSLLGVGLAHHLKETSLFQLTSLATSVSCFQDYQSKLSSLSLPDEIVSHCFDPMEFVSSPNICAQVQTLHDWVAKLGKSTVLDSACRPDLVDLASCSACVAAGFKVQSDLLLIGGNKSHATDCFYFTVLYAAGIANEFGPESNGALTCIFGLELDLETNVGSSSKGHSALVFGLTGASVAILVMSSFLGLYFWYDKKWRKKNNSTFPFNLEEQGSRPRLRPNTGSIWFKIDDLEKATENFSQENFIGRGGFGLVYKGILSDGTTVAVKRVIESDIQEDALDVSLLRDRDLSNPNPKAIMERFVLVGILCAHVMVALRPTILDALKMLEGDIEVPPIPDRPMPLSHPSSFGDDFTIPPAPIFPQVNSGDMLR